MGRARAVEVCPQEETELARSELLAALTELKTLANDGQGCPPELVDRALRAARCVRPSPPSGRQELEAILAAVYRLAARDYDYRLPERGGDGIADYIALGLNMLADVLESTTVSRRYLDGILDTMIDPVLVVDAEGVVRANVAAARELGVPPDAIEGRALESFMLLERDGELRPLTLGLLASCASGNVARDLKVKLITTEDELIPVSVNAAWLADGTASSPQMVLVARDMREVLGLVEAAREASRLKSELVAHVSHELRTPMQGVIGTTSLLLRSELSPAQKLHLETIARSSETLLALVDDLLDLSKLEARRMRLEARPLELRTLAQDVITLLTPRATQAGLTLELDIAPDVPDVVVGDQHRLRQVLINLCGNAVKFTEQGGACLRMRVSPRQRSSAARLRIEVIDTGLGIPAETQKTMFEPFSRGRGDASQRVEGTGLGLAICRHLVELMGAELSCESAPAVGSRFWFDLPLRRPASTSPPVSRPPTSSTPPARPARVLVAEDDPMNRSLLASMLEALGVLSDTVGDGRQAVAAVRTGQYDIVFLDWEMPGMTGLEAARAIRAAEAAQVVEADQPAPRVPMVCLSGRVGESMRAQLEAVGMDDHLAKPFGLSRLNAVLERWLPERVALG